MPQMVTPDELVLRELVGMREYLPAMQLATRGAVELHHLDESEIVGTVTGAGARHGVHVRPYRGWDGAIDGFDEKCTCPAYRCGHGLALLIAALRSGSGPAPRPAWERALDLLETPEAASAGEAEIALQLDLTLPDGPAGGRRVDRPQIRLRPVARGKTGKWVRQGVSWSTVAQPRYGVRPLSEPVRRLLTELLALSGAAAGYYYQEPVVQLESIASRRVWDLLAEAAETGLPLVQSGAKPGPVLLHEGTAHASFQLESEGEGLVVQPSFTLAGDSAEAEAAPIGAGDVLALGWPGHGLAWWDQSGPGSGRAATAAGRALHLARLDAPLAPEVLRLMGEGPLRVPGEDRNRFLRDYYPRLTRRIPVQSSTAIAVPEILPPALRLTVVRLPGHRLTAAWDWVYRVDQKERLVPLGGADPDRDRVAEQNILARLARSAWPEELRVEPGGAPSPQATLAGMPMVRLLADVLPAVSQLEGVEVLIEVADDAPEYREAEEAPLITLTGEGDGGRDWFDLAVSVQIGEELVPFDELFTALATEEPYLLLPSGTYFGLHRPEFRQLAALIEEARALDDAAADGTVRLSRFQAGLWGELEQIGVVTGQAAEWQRSVQALRELAEVARHEVPNSVQAELRPYQVAGFGWLATLYDLGLGGVLADDMGLGKTLQTLALIAHRHQADPAGPPFLVVAPTSVASNWASEAARFTPGLRVAVVSETLARRGVPLAELAAGADLVVTTYTLFRLEYEAYAEVGWAGLVLDEAQLVKNHQGRGYQCARRLPAPFKLAITGTPMENNLMELWALLSITAPGLFPSPTRFTEYYRNPIERNRDATLLDQLRRRVKPLMLRRSKEEAAPDLPAKQEQVLELELNPKHRKAYQTYLQRERQKVLGLLGDLQKNRFEIFRSLTLLRQAALDVSLVDAAKHHAVSATKLDELMELVAEVNREGHRALVFSQFTRFLGGARTRLEAAGVEFCYLDGKTRDRASVIERFKSGAAPVFLISLKAGGFGLNLTEADYCIMLDPWWNPATEAQAVDRTHRIGQTKNVMVYRLVAEDTIEEKVMALKAEKSALFDSVMDGGAFESSALTADDIRTLLD